MRQQGYQLKIRHVVSMGRAITRGRDISEQSSRLPLLNLTAHGGHLDLRKKTGCQGEPIRFELLNLILS